MTEIAEEKQLPNVSILPSSQLWGFSLTKDNYNAVLDRLHLCPGYEPTAGVATGGFATWEKNSSASERIGLVSGCVSVYLDRQDRNTQAHLSLVSVRTSEVPKIWTLANLFKLDNQNLSTQNKKGKSRQSRSPQSIEASVVLGWYTPIIL